MSFSFIRNQSDRMRTALPIYLPLFWLCIPQISNAQAQPRPIMATVESSLTSDSGKIRQFAFDGDDKSYFSSTANVTDDDHFTLVFDKPVELKSVLVVTGKPKGGDELNNGNLETSADGKKFEVLAKFKDGTAKATLKGQKTLAVRVKPGKLLNQPLTIREIKIESNPPVAVFKYPVEFVVDSSDDPEMKDWAQKAARICEREYAMIGEELASDGFKPPTVISLSLEKKYRGVAATSRDRIVGSIAYFKTHADDFGAMVHETVHCVQSYRTHHNPGWLVEGIADYIRFYKYEPGKIGRINPDRAKYNSSYRVSASFLAYLTDKYDKEIVRKLNKAMREGEYKETIFKELTKKTLQELDEEWRASLRKADK